MTIARVPRWVWLLIGLAAGWGVGYARQASRSGDFSRYGIQIKNPKRFEAALAKAPSGARAFQNLVVYPETLSAPGGGRRATLHVVAGDYAGPPLNGEDVTAAAPDAPNWRRAYFVAEPPYGSCPTVMSYLNAEAIPYAFAWWRRPLFWNTLHLSAGVLAIGLILPTVINLLAYGSLWRPKEEKAPYLPPSPGSAPVAPTQPSAEQLDAVLDQYEQGVASTADSTAAAAESAKVAPAPAVAALSAGPLQPVAAAADRADKEFGAARDDYYPTELKAPHPEPTKRKA
jgi:hypothetical protein